MLQASNTGKKSPQKKGKKERRNRALTCAGGTTNRQRVASHFSKQSNLKASTKGSHQSLRQTQPRGNKDY
jgi:hypothetical protein